MSSRQFAAPLAGLGFGLTLGVGLTVMFGPSSAAQGAHASAASTRAPSRTAERVSAAPFAAPAARVARDAVAAASLAPPTPEAVEAAARLGAAEGLAVESAAEGARGLTSFLVEADRPEELLAVARAVAEDPTMSALVGAEAERLRGSPEAGLRARGVAIAAALGALDLAGWRAALAGEHDVAARAAIVATAPLAGDPAADAALVGELLEVARLDPAPGVRAAALTRLPALDAAGLAAVAAALEGDPAPEVRRVAASYLRGARSIDGAAVRGLLAAASRDEDLAVRRTAALALLRLEERAPAAIAAAGATREQLQLLLAATSQDQG